MKKMLVALTLLLVAGCQAKKEEPVPETTGGGNIMGERPAMDTLKNVGEQKDAEAKTLEEK